ncbi:hypothetical protein [Maridesulfovibrio sp.]|uniref:hypothetical protein n=1 Tax=Maridesulfovibrio sp. TaxID=2795000 RepID=UPI0029CA65EA|nr:hypothetical protein [Maridesulfovibrio sp.]
MYILKKGQENKFQDLIPLGETDWPDNVKKEICDFFKAAGVDDPMTQKLVEPGLQGFRFKNDKDEIDWDDVVAYFKYEALSVLIMHDDKFKEKAEELYTEFFANHKFKVWNRD